MCQKGLLPQSQFPKMCQLIEFHFLKILATIMLLKSYQDYRVFSLSSNWIFILCLLSSFQFLKTKNDYRKIKRFERPEKNSFLHAFGNQSIFALFWCHFFIIFKNTYFLPTLTLDYRILYSKKQVHIPGYFSKNR